MLNTLQVLVSLLAIQSLLVHGRTSSSVFQTTTNNHNDGTVSSTAVQHWLEQKCPTKDKNPFAVWVYEGDLYDPMTGNKIAHVNGMELLRPLAHASLGKSETYQKKCRGLAIFALLFPSKTTSDDSSNPDWDSATTVLSRKVFCYTDNDKLLQHIPSKRRSKHKKKKSIPQNQVVSVWDAATTYVCRNPKELYIHTEQPNGSCLSSSTVLDCASRQGLDFTLYTKRKHSNKSLPPPLRNDTSVNITPPRLRLIQFGSDKKQRLDKFGARETYSYKMSTRSASIPSSLFSRFKRVFQEDSLPETTSVVYTRYGEGPPWYGPGRMCALELRGKRVDSIKDVPPVLLDTCHHAVVPKFLAQEEASAEVGSKRRNPWWKPRQATLTVESAQDQHGMEDATQAVELFRKDDASSLRQPTFKPNPWQTRWKRFRAATHNSKHKY